MTALRGALPGSTTDELDRSLALLADIDTRSLGLAEVLGCAAGPPIEATDALGPVPGLCLDEESTPPVAGGEGDPGSVPAPGSESGGATPTAPPGAPGGATGGEAPGSEGEGGSLPTTEVPSGTGGLPSVPVPTIPLPSVSVGVSVPGSSPSTGSSGPSSSSPSSSSPSIDLDICLGPIVVGNCP